MSKTLNRIAMSVAGVTLLMSGIAFAANSAPSTAPGQNKLQCFDGVTDGGGYGGTCTLTSNGAKGPATLDLTSDNTAGDYAGVYTLESKLYGMLLSDITQMSYNYTGTKVPTPGNLSFNVPVNTSDGTTTDAYVFIDAFYCPGIDGEVDIINDPNCGMYYGGVTFFANWAALVAAYPDATVATDSYAFIVAERTPSEEGAVWTVNNVKFGKGGR